MSTISSISSTTNPYLVTNQTDRNQTVKDFRAISSALQSGDLSTAKSALASFQQDLQASSQTSATQPFGSNTQANTDYQQLTAAVQSGNLSAAQTAFASLQTDLQGATKAHHHHHHSVTAASATQTSNTNTGSILGNDSNTLNVTA